MSEYYSIGKISKMCGVTIKTLRYYDKIDLLVPEYRDEETNYRYYTEKQMVDVLIIRRLRELDMSIKDIKEIISNPSILNYSKLIGDNSNILAKEIEMLETKKSACDVILNRIEKAHNIICNKDKSVNLSDNILNLQIEDIPESKILYSRKLMKNYDNARVSLDRWLEIYEECTKNGISMQSPIRTTYYDEPLSQFLLQDCDVEFGVVINANKNLHTLESKTRINKAHKACTAYHIGKYSNIMNSHVALIQWINHENYEISGPISEVFIISPLDIQDEKQHITKIIIPIEKKKK